MPRKAKIDNDSTVKTVVDIFSQPTNQTDKVVENSKTKRVKRIVGWNAICKSCKYHNIPKKK